MGRIVKNLGEGVTKYYWYPGQKSDWVKTGICLGAGALAFVLCYVLSKNSLSSAVLAASVTTGLGGFFLGRRDVAALAELHDMNAERRAAMMDGGKAAWRATVQGFVVAGSAIFVINMPHSGLWADWVLPLVPSLVGAVAHSVGMLYERMTQVAADQQAATLAQQSEDDVDAKGSHRLERAG